MGQSSSSEDGFLGRRSGIHDTEARDERKKRMLTGPGMVEHAYNSSTQEAEAGAS
jgi:hypothetical protein